jgi:hypothetical protein
MPLAAACSPPPNKTLNEGICCSAAAAMHSEMRLFEEKERKIEES